MKEDEHSLELFLSKMVVLECYPFLFKGYNI